jgi:hypothetical protein
VVGFSIDTLRLQPASYSFNVGHGQTIDDTAACELANVLGEPRQPFGLSWQYYVLKP